MPVGGPAGRGQAPAALNAAEAASELARAEQLLRDGSPDAAEQVLARLPDDVEPARLEALSRIGLTAEDVDKNDYLMDWRRDGHGLRYVHHFSASELHQLAAFTGFRVIGIFTSDGEGENLGLYQIWTKKRPL